MMVFSTTSIIQIDQVDARHLCDSGALVYYAKRIKVFLLGRI